MENYTGPHNPNSDDDLEELPFFDTNRLLNQSVNLLSAGVNITQNLYQLASASITATFPQEAAYPYHYLNENNISMPTQNNRGITLSHIDLSAAWRYGLPPYPIEKRESLPHHA
jgi:hypothetical protein